MCRKDVFMRKFKDLALSIVALLVSYGVYRLSAHLLRSMDNEFLVDFLVQLVFAIALLLNIHDSSFSKCRYYSDDRTVNKSKAVYINYNRSGPDKNYAKKCQRKIENTMADG